MKHRSARGVRPRSVLALAVASAVAAACSGPTAAPPDEPLRVLMVGNPQMLDLQRLTSEGFTRRTGVEVEYTVLPENEVREKIDQEFASQAGHYDVASVSNFEVPFFARYGWLAPLDSVVNEPAFAQSDILSPVRDGLTGEDGRVYAEPFYGESSFLMYRRDVLEERGLSMPERPTWQQVAEIAAQVDGARPGMRGICLRGLPGWGEMVAPLTTVVNTFGGTWFDDAWEAQVDSPEFRDATAFYVDLLRAHGQPDAHRSGFLDCLESMRSGSSAMWYDATSAAGELEAEGSPVAGRIGYAQAPVVRTDSSGWLFTWAWGVQKASRKQAEAADFVAWASGREYEELVGERLGWARVPAGKRSSTYQHPEYLRYADAFAAATLTAIDAANPRAPGVQPRPTVGIQFVGIPEFTALGTMASREFSRAIAGEQTVEEALAATQVTAQQVGQRYQGR